MAVSATLPQPAEHSLGGFRGTVVDLALAANDYVTGGISVASYAPGTLVGCLVLAQTGTARGYLPVFDQPNEKLMLFQQVDPADSGGANTALVEVTNGSSSAATFRLLLLWI